MTAATPLPAFGGFRFDGKRALVTGGGRGLGLAAGVALAQGAEVTLAARSGAGLEAACAAIRAQGADADFLVLDVTAPAAVQRAIGSRPPSLMLDGGWTAA